MFAHPVCGFGKHFFIFMSEKEEESPTEADLTGQDSHQVGITEHGIRIWTPVQVKEWIVDHVGLKQEIGETFLQQEISGEVLIVLTVEDIRNVCPDIAYGNARCILMKRDDIMKGKEGSFSKNDAMQMKQEKGQTKSERYRKFDTDVTAAFAYVRGRYLPPASCAMDNLLKPVHYFVEGCGEDELRFQQEIMHFVCACLNHRTNGTIHVGVGNGKSSGEGKVLGVDRSLRDWQTLVQKAREIFFPVDQVQIVRHCMRPIKIIKVVPEKDEAHCDELCVLEVDVIPENEICEAEVFYAKRMKGDKLGGSLCILHFSKGFPAILPQDGYRGFYEMIPKLCQLRTANFAQEERKPHFDKNLRRKVEDLFGRGQGDFSRDLFPILVTSGIPADTTPDDVKSQFGFVKDVPWSAVFDFDNGKEDTSLYRFMEEVEEQVVNVLRVEDFDAQSQENSRQSGRLEGLLRDLKENKSITPWLFANGCASREEKTMNVTEWNRHRIKGLKEAVRFLQGEIPRERAVVVFMLLSEDDVMREAAFEFCTEFPEQWCILSESETVADGWKALVRSRHITENEEELEKNCIVGLPWGHLNQTMLQLLDVRRGGTRELISCNGVYVTLKEKLRNDLTDLDILGMNQCENEDIVDDDTKLRKFGIQMEEAFYRGGVADWWNFYFGSHVLSRDCYQNMRRHIQDILNGKVEEEERVGRYTIYHEPGAGGTTTAKQLLWDLRSQLRCAIVGKITDETCRQITRLHMYESGKKPVPLLLLLDNHDDERVSDLKAELEEKAKQDAREFQDAPQLFYILLLCKRKSTIPQPRDTQRTILKQQLSPREMNWFKDKYQLLEKTYKEEKGSDPKHLISFNIMKENFNVDYIRRTVEEITKEIGDINERRLLTYLSLLNSYVVDFESVPLSSFDSMMIEDEHGTCHWGRSGDAGWEKCLSSPLKLLIHQLPRKGCGTVIRIINNALSREVLNTFLRLPTGAEDHSCLSEIAANLLHSSIFRTVHMDASVTQLLKVIRVGVKRRRRKADGRHETLFAPLIQDIVDDEQQSVPRAAAVLARVYELSKDAFVGQQLTRLYIKVAKNWEEAERYATEITEMHPKNSYLLDTLGRVYKEQVAEMHEINTQSMSSTEPQNARRALELAFKSVDIFHKVQELSEREKAKSFVNSAGYYGEVAVVIQLLDYLSNVKGLHEPPKLHDFLVNDASPVIAEFRMHWSMEEIAKLRALEKGAKRALTRIEDEQLQLRDAVVDDYRKSLNPVRKECLVKLKENFETYYGEESNEVPAGFDLQESCKYRRRRILRLSGTGFRGVFEMRRREDGEKLLNVIKKLASENMQTGFKDSFDIQTLISVNITLCSMGRSFHGVTSHPEMAHLSYDLLQEQNAEGVSLEPYLFAVMFNWPRRSMDFRPKLTVNRFPETIKKWKEAYLRKYPRQADESKPYKKKDTTLFFLGSGNGMEAFAFEQELRDQAKRTGARFWNSPVAIKRLERWEGVLVNDGAEVKLTLEQNGNKFLLYLPTSFPITTRRWFNKRVFCVVGFTWWGPKAFDIDPDDKRNRTGTSVEQGPPVPIHRQRGPKPYMEFETKLHLQAEFHRQVEGLSMQLREIEWIKQKPRHHLSQFEVR